ncbi:MULTISPECIES: DUF6957 family protein [Pseudomonas]|uniref:DUF6957 domain-containing protein n=4 Tax=Pseudomonas TaxID=286 RepID=A0AAW4DR17_PSESX|nr:MULTISPECIES: hypothetical protein [Pseudomonas]AVI84069.1 hypothetical protein XJ28_10265 [Pseudomonas syringae pv. tomato]EEB59157.1 hypothetical protein PSPTOT1_1215 [Pseudomonas syringae pv. tomato T1]KGK94183.1 hypothetical protein NB04_18310 [Pseudomonas syringae pv. tomato]KOP57776.1 hypothetical protein OX88_04380 [Pseudomonas coronafaciens pv. porri]KOP60677.1 hypothetical protein OX90_04880 [Pseudomonas coronafaciens pv. porri]
MTGPVQSELFLGGSEPRQGSSASVEEIVATLAVRAPPKAYCLVEEWTIFRADLTPAELTRVHAADHLPLILFAHKVVVDSRARFQPGDWVRSSMCTAFDDGIMFETKNTIYVLMGAGHEQTASLKTIFSFF